MVVKNNQTVFDKAYSVATEFQIVLDTIEVARNVFDMELSSVHARKVLEWFFDSYVENVKKDKWNEEVLAKMLEEFVNAYASEKLTRKKR